MYDQVRINDYTGSFYLSGDYRTNYSNYSFYDINVEKYNKLTINVIQVYGDASVFTFTISADGTNVLNITRNGTYTIDVSEKTTVRLYYYERSGYYFAKGTYTLTRY